MKRFGVLAMAIVAIALSVVFVACSDDDDGGSSAASSGRKLVKLYGGSYDWDIDLLYDSEGYLTTAKSWDGDDYSYNYNYTWYDDSFQERVGGSYNNTYYYAGGLVSSYSNKWETTSYEYDSSNHLLSARNGETTSTLTWEGDQLTRIIQTNKYDDDYDYDITFSYDGKSCKGFLPLLPFWEPIIYPGILYDDDDGCGIVNANPGMFGLNLTALPNKITQNGKTYEYSYKLDNKSDVTGCTSSRDGEEYETYTFVWE